MRRRARPEAPSADRRRQFISDNPNSRYGELRARSTAYRRAARRGRDDAKIGEGAISTRLTDKPLISLETAKEKAWNFLGNPWNSLEKLAISLEQFGNPWKSLAPRRQDTQPLLAGVGWRAKPSPLPSSRAKRGDPEIAPSAYWPAGLPCGCCRRRGFYRRSARSLDRYASLAMTVATDRPMDRPPYPRFSAIAARAASAPERIAPVKPPVPAKEEAR